MNSTNIDSALADLQSQVRSSQKIIPTGNRTKPALSATSSTANFLSTLELTGIVSYDPSEFLITARSGTPISELELALQDHGQYLPFDPILADQGSTLGGTIASGISGKRQLLYGSSRDFVMEIEFIDGNGDVIRGGGKVVKNSAGFDLPKLFVGSYGRLGILTEVTLKVLPRPKDFQLTKIGCSDMCQCVERMQKLRSNPLPIASLEVTPDLVLYCEFAGLDSALPDVISRASAMLQEPLEIVAEEERDSLFSTTDTSLIRCVCFPDKLDSFATEMSDCQAQLARLSAGGTIAWITIDDSTDVAALDSLLAKQGFSAVQIRGTSPTLQTLGDRTWISSAKRVQHALDPVGRFLSYSSAASRELQ